MSFFLADPEGLELSFPTCCLIFSTSSDRGGTVSPSVLFTWINTEDKSYEGHRLGSVHERNKKRGCFDMVSIFGIFLAKGEKTNNKGLLWCGGALYALSVES